MLLHAGKLGDTNLWWHHLAHEKHSARITSTLIQPPYNYRYTSLRSPCRQTRIELHIQYTNTGSDNKHTRPDRAATNIVVERPTPHPVVTSPPSLLPHTPKCQADCVHRWMNATDRVHKLSLQTRHLMLNSCSNVDNVQ